MRLPYLLQYKLLCPVTLTLLQVCLSLMFHMMIHMIIQKFSKLRMCHWTVYVKIRHKKYNNYRSQIKAPPKKKLNLSDSLIL